MLTADLLNRFRLAMVDVEEPYLWTDEEAFDYMNQAQVEFARKTGGIGDASTPAVTLLTIGPTDVMVSTHKSILRIYNAFNVDTGRPVDVINYNDAVKCGMRFTAQPGPIRALIIGMEPHKARAVPLVQQDAVLTLQLLVDRLPLVEIVGAVGEELEVDDQYVPTLMMWMKHLAYSKQDAETFDRSRAADFEGRFLAAADDAKAEKERALHKTRVVQYGGI